MRAIFFGGVLDGQEREIAGARDYLAPVGQMYRRARTVYVDGMTIGSNSNQGRISHVEMHLLESK